MPLSTQSEALLTTFGHQTGVTADQVDNLRNVINGSPALVAQVNAAVAAGHLKHFAALPAGEHAGGSYNGATGTMNLPLSILTTPASGSINKAEITFVRCSIHSQTLKRGWRGCLMVRQIRVRSPFAMHQLRALVAQGSDHRQIAASEIR